MARQEQEQKPRRRRRPPPAEPAEPAAPAFELMVVTRPPGLVRRALAVNHQFAGLLSGGIIAHARARKAAGRGGPALLLERFLAPYKTPPR